MRNKLMLLTLCAGFLACASMKQSKDEAAINKISKVAVVAFEITEPTSSKIGINLGGAVSGYPNYGEFNKLSPHADEIYKVLLTSLNTNLQWQVLNSEKMKSNPDYVRIFNKTMKGMHNKMPVAQEHVQFVAAKVMDVDSIRILDIQERELLYNSLRVDAIVTARINVDFSGTSIMGFGSRKPQAHLTFTVYTRGQDKPIWFEADIEGDEAKESVGSTGFIDTDKLAMLSTESSKSAFNKLSK